MMWDTTTLIARAAILAARRLLAEPTLFERASGDVRQSYDYDGWAVDTETVLPALASAARTVGQARDVATVAADARLATEFICRITPTGSPDYYEGDADDPDDFDLGPSELLGADLQRALQIACDLAEQYGWVR